MPDPDRPSDPGPRAPGHSPARTREVAIERALEGLPRPVREAAAAVGTEEGARPAGTALPFVGGPSRAVDAVDNDDDSVWRDAGWLALASALAAVGPGGRRGLAAAVAAHTLGGFDPERMREALLQLLLFAGYPRSLEALATFRETLEAVDPRAVDRLRTTALEPILPAVGASHHGRIVDGDAPASSPQSTSGARCVGARFEDWAARGLANNRAVYGSQTERLRQNARRLSPDLEEWMIVEGYGRVLGRPGLPFVVRELCVAACLVPLDAPRQLKSHLRGAIQVGVPPRVLDRVLALLAAVLPPIAIDRAREAWQEVRPRDGDQSSGASPTANRPSGTTADPHAVDRPS